MTLNSKYNSMSNLLNNRLNVELSVAQREGINEGIQILENNLNFLIGLTVEERVSLPAIDVNNKAFTEDAINAGSSNPTLIPPYISVEGMKRDYVLFTQLDEVKMRLNQLIEKINDTQLLAGSEAYVSALALYKIFGSAADAGVPGSDAVYSQLKKRFAGQGGATKTATDPNA